MSRDVGVLLPPGSLPFPTPPRRLSSLTVTPAARGPPQRVLFRRIPCSVDRATPSAAKKRLHTLPNVAALTCRLRGSGLIVGFVHESGSHLVLDNFLVEGLTGASRPHLRAEATLGPGPGGPDATVLCPTPFLTGVLIFHGSAARFHNDPLGPGNPHGLPGLWAAESRPTPLKHVQVKCKDSVCSTRLFCKQRASPAGTVPGRRTG